MSRGVQVLPSDVLSILESRDQATRAEIAEQLECCPGTVSHKISRLVKDGENIGFNKAGLFLQNKEDITNDNNADLAMQWTNRIFNSLKMWARRGGNHKSVAIAARRRLAKELTKEERKALKGELLLINRVIDATDLDEELQEA